MNQENLIEKYNLKVGDKIRCFPSDSPKKELIGIIGEINPSNFYVWNNIHNGSCGNISPARYPYSWSMLVYNNTKITVLNKINCRKLNKILCSKKTIK